MPYRTDSLRRRVVQVNHLRFAWPGQTPLFDGLSITLVPGLHLVRGDDGCGQSTLLALLAGEQSDFCGTVVVDGVNQALDRAAYRQRVFWIDPATDAHDSICANDFFAAQRERFPGFLPGLANELADALGLAPHQHKPLYMLSAGSKRKVWLSAALASGAPLTLIDQAFAALDAPSARLLQELLVEASNHRERAFLLADHVAPQGLVLGQVIDL